MGLIRIIDKFYAEKYCKPLLLDGYNYFYPCTKDKCFKKYDRGMTFSTNGKVYRICMLFMQESDFDKAVRSKIEKAGKIFREFYRKFLF